MAKTGFRLDATQMRKKLERLQQIPASAFKREVGNFTQAALNRSYKAVPTRDADIIAVNQRKQWAIWKSKGGEGVTEASFVKQRSQARFLFKLSIAQAAFSAGLSFPVSAQVLGSQSRNDDEPARSWAQWHGGKNVLSISIHTPFLDEPKRKYKNFTGKEIIGAEMERGQPVFKRAVDRQLKRITYAIMHA